MFGRNEARLIDAQSPTAHTVYVGSTLTLVFSYETCVAFAIAGDGWTVSENIWSRTTGKHLAQTVPSGVKRTPHDEFAAKLDRVLSTITADSLLKG